MLRKIPLTTIPFKNNEFDYAELLAWTGDNMKLGLVDFIPIVILSLQRLMERILMDGIDGLAAGTSVISVAALVFAFVSKILFCPII
jgi:phospho-N-acetylmuramoyl-pentapeptide-transferase